MTFISIIYFQYELAMNVSLFSDSKRKVNCLCSHEEVRQYWSRSKYENQYHNISILLISYNSGEIPFIFFLWNKHLFLIAPSKNPPRVPFSMVDEFSFLYAHFCSFRAIYLCRWYNTHAQVHDMPKHKDLTNKWTRHLAQKERKKRLQNVMLVLSLNLMFKKCVCALFI